MAAETGQTQSRTRADRGFIIHIFFHYTYFFSLYIFFFIVNIFFLCIVREHIESRTRADRGFSLYDMNALMRKYRHDDSFQFFQKKKGKAQSLTWVD